MKAPILTSIIALCCVWGLGCIDFPIPSPMGAPCSKASDCNTDFCHGGVCLSLTGDDDGDQLTNFDEQQFGTNPTSADSDGDQLTDKQEIGDPAMDNIDRDGDGLNDALEHNTKDEDLDCLPDWADPRNGIPDASQSELVRYHCATLGVCADKVDHITVTCTEGKATCHYEGANGNTGETEAACDGVDENCNGLVDDGFSADGVPGQFCTGLGACGAGVIECSSDQQTAVCSTEPGGSTPGNIPELCDGFDNDCDGEVDEGYVLGNLQIGDSCVAVGACGTGSGLVQCVADLNAPLCIAKTGPTHWVGPELCDGIDTDCDGQIDEELVDSSGLAIAGIGEPCGEGNCSGGLVVCSEAGTPVCSTEFLSKPEVCDGMDNDCDGVVDNGMLFLGQPIGNPCTALGECGAGVVECSTDTMVPICSTGPGGSQSTVSKELCDGLDNDCNGLVDDGIGLAIDGETYCTLPGVCGDGVLICGEQGTVVCSSAPGQPGSNGGMEACNGLDDDCDGFTDEYTQGPLAAEWSMDTISLAVAPGSLLRATGSSTHLFYDAVGAPEDSAGTWRFEYETGLNEQLPKRPGSKGAPAALLWDPQVKRLVALDNALNEFWGRVDILDENGVAWFERDTDALPISNVSCAALWSNGLLVMSPEGLWYLDNDEDLWEQMPTPSGASVDGTVFCHGSAQSNHLSWGRLTDNGDTVIHQCLWTINEWVDCEEQMLPGLVVVGWTDFHSLETIYTQGEATASIAWTDDIMPVLHGVSPSGVPSGAWWEATTSSGMVLLHEEETWRLARLSRQCP